MIKRSITLLALFFSMQAMGQAKKIGYRHDDYLNSAWKGIDSIIYDYDVDSNMTLLYAVKGNTSNGWDLNFRYTYTYDTNHRKTGQVREKAVSGSFVNDNKYVYTYDASGNIVLIEYFVWNGNAWQNNGKITYSGYNSYGKYASVLTQSWTNNTWANVGKSDYTYYNSQYLVQSQEDYIWDVNTINWKKYQRRYYTYVQDSIGSVTLSEPDSNQNWKSISKVINSYNTNTMLIVQKRNLLYDTLGQSYDINHTLYTYSGSNKLIERKYELPSGSNWIPQNRITFLYNTGDTLTEFFTEQYTGTWTLDSRTTLSYTNGLVSEEKHFDGSSGNWIETEKINNTYNSDSLITYIQKDNFSGSSYTPVKREFFYYNIYPLSITSLSAMSTLTVYPNPAGDYLDVLNQAAEPDIALVQVYDMQGRLTLSVAQNGTANKSPIRVHTQDLPPGFYSIRLQYSHQAKQAIGLFIKE